MIIKIKQLILGGEYEIKFVKTFRGFKNLPIKGFIVPESDTILINQNMADDEKIVTIIHEFIHELEPTWSEAKVEKKCQELFDKLNRTDRHFFKQLL